MLLQKHTAKQQSHNIMQKTHHTKKKPYNIFNRLYLNTLNISNILLILSDPLNFNQENVSLHLVKSSDMPWPPRYQVLIAPVCIDFDADRFWLPPCKRKNSINSCRNDRQHAAIYFSDLLCPTNQFYDAITHQLVAHSNT